jgi:hypothetical protein
MGWETWELCKFGVTRRCCQNLSCCLNGRSDKSTPASVSYTGEGWVSMACTTCSLGAANSQTLPGRTDVTVLVVLACEPVNLLACMVDTS